MRNCKVCACTLPKERYFKCFKCQPILPSMDDSFIYHTEEFDSFTEETIGGLYDDNPQAFYNEVMAEVEDEEAWKEGEVYNDEDNSSEEDGQEEWEDSD